MIGTVKTIYADKGFGFISLPNGARNLFFHCTDLVDDLAFDEQLVELRVQFEQEATRKGQRAANVRPAV